MATDTGRPAQRFLDRERSLVWILLAAAALRLLLMAWTPPDWLSWEARENYPARARAILEGALPYRDFWESKPPLWSFTFAAWGALFGLGPFSEKTLILLGELGFLALLYGFGKRIFGRARPETGCTRAEARGVRPALLAVSLYAFLPVAPFVSAVEGKYESLTFLFLVGSLWLFLDGKAWAGGLLAGLGMAFKYNVAFAPAAAALYVFAGRLRPVRPLVAFLGTAVGTAALALVPFVALNPAAFYRDTIQNFLVGTGHHVIDYKALSWWGALRTAFGVTVPSYVPYACEAALIVVVVFALRRRRPGASGIELVRSAYVLIMAHLMFLRVGNIQYHLWSVPFGVLLAAHVLGEPAASRSGRRFAALFVAQSVLALITWKNWFAPVGGPVLVALTLALSGWLLWMALRLELSVDARRGARQNEPVTYPPFTPSPPRESTA